MKIYTRIVLDMTQDDLPVIESESHEYHGPVALAMGWGDDGPGRDGMGIGGEGVGNDFGGFRSPSPGARGSRAGSTNAAGFGLGSAMGGTYGERGGAGYSGAAGRAESMGIGPSGGYDRGFDNRDERGMLQGVTRDDMRAIEDARAQARRQDPNPSLRDTVANIADLMGTAIKGLGVMGMVTSGPIGWGAAARFGQGVISQQRDDMAYRDALGLGPLGMPDGFGLDGTTPGFSGFGGNGFGSGTSPMDILQSGSESTTQAEEDLGPVGPRIDPTELENLGSLDDENSPMAIALDMGWEVGMRDVRKEALRKAIESMMQKPGKTVPAAATPTARQAGREETTRRTSR